MDDLDRSLGKHLQDPDFRREWERLGPLYDMIAATIRLRHERGLSQSELATRMGKQQPAIARFEAGRAENPSLSFLQQLAEALDVRIVLKLEPKEETQEATKIAEEKATYSG